MNDEQFEHRIREAARRIADRAAPRSLRLRVAAIPAERPRTGRPKRRLGDLMRVPATGASFAVVAVAAAIVVAIWSRGSAVVPGTTSSPSVPASEAPTSPVSSMPTFTWTQVMSTDAGGPLLRDGDTIMSAVSLSGGYVLAGNAGNGQHAVVWQSPDGVTWHRIDSGADFASSLMTALVPVPDGVLALGISSSYDPLCIGGEGTRCNPVNPIRLWISPDGRTWQRLPDAATAVFGRAQLGPVAAGPGGLVLFGWQVPVTADLPKPMEWTSTDGRSWQEQTQFAGAFPQGVVEGLVAGTDGFSAVGRNTGLGSPHAPGTAWFSADGRTWTAASVPRSTDEQTSVFAGDAGLLVAGSTASGRTLWSSPDGRSWTDVDLSGVPFSASGTSLLLVSDGTEIIAVGTDRAGAAGVWVTRNGTSWQPMASSDPVPPIPDTGGGTVGALGRQGVVVATTANTAGAISTSVWVGAVRNPQSPSPSTAAAPNVVCDRSAPISAGTDDAGSPIPVTLTCEAAVAAAKAVVGPDPAITYIEFDYLRWCPPGFFCAMSTFNDGHVIFHMNGQRPDIVVQVMADEAGRVTASSPQPLPSPPS